MTTKRSFLMSMNFKTSAMASVLALAACVAYGVATLPESLQFDEGTLDGNWQTAGSTASVGWTGNAGQGLEMINNSGTLTPLSLTRTYINGGSTLVADFYAKPVRGGAASFSTDARAVFYVQKATGQLVVYKGTVQEVLASPSAHVPDGEWARFTVSLNYGTQKWSLSLNGKSVVDGYDFYKAAGGSFSKMVVYEASSTSKSYLDTLAIGSDFGGEVVVDNANGAEVATSGGVIVSTTLKGEVLAPNTFTRRIYYGTADGGTGSWASFANSGTGSGACSVPVSIVPDTIYYYRTAAVNGGDKRWADTTYMLMAQTRTSGQWHLVSVPGMYGNSTEQQLNGAAGAALATGMNRHGSSSQGDLLYVVPIGTPAWQQYFLSDEDGLWHNSSTPAIVGDALVLPGMAVWEKRSTLSPGTSYTVFTAPKPVPGNVLDITFPNDSWQAFGWVSDAKGTSDGPLVGWGFPASGATTGANVDSADNIIAKYGSKWYTLYLKADGKWYEQGFPQNPTSVKLQPGMAYYYYHRGPNVMTSWKAPLFSP